MCWNASISLNTFIFSVATLGFIAYNNAYTKYKLPEFTAGPWLYAFILSVSGMQLVEYFLWSGKSPTTGGATFGNANTNNTMSIVGSLLLITQPFFLSLAAGLPKLTMAYAAFAFLFILAKYPNNLARFSTVKTGEGLEWRWYDDYEYQWIYYLAYWATAVACAFYVPVYLSVAIFGVAAITLARWWNGKTLMWASKYCWGLNVLAFYYLYRIMIAMPFKEMLGTCKN